MPRFQLYAAARAFPAPEDVMRHWDERASDELFIDSAGTAFMNTTPGPGAGRASLEVLERASSRGVVRVRSAVPVWLFMADANYPGWRARIGRQDVPLYSAQVLGKAVAVPAGDNVVEFAFVATSFRVGLALSLSSLAVVLVLLVLHLARRYRLRANSIHRMQPVAPG
jgi:hypothetical protein